MTRLCKVFLLVDFKRGITEHDMQFLERSQQIKLGMELIYSRVDRVHERDWMDRALSLAFQVKKYNEFVSPLVHLTSANNGFGVEGLESAIMQNFLESPTRKIVRKNNLIYHMLESSEGEITKEEQRKYRSLIQEAQRERIQAARQPSEAKQLRDEIIDLN